MYACCTFPDLCVRVHVCVCCVHVFTGVHNCAAQLLVKQNAIMKVLGTFYTVNTCSHSCLTTTAVSFGWQLNPVSALKASSLAIRIVSLKACLRTVFVNSQIAGHMGPSTAVFSSMLVDLKRLCYCWIL